jgi:hypothetical protein
MYMMNGKKTSAFCFLRVSLALVKTGAYNMDH